jgi:hypothetical protein
MFQCVICKAMHYNIERCDRCGVEMCEECKRMMAGLCSDCWGDLDTTDEYIESVEGVKPW